MENEKDNKQIIISFKIEEKESIILMLPENSLRMNLME
jgi:hypothetical protein